MSIVRLTHEEIIKKANSYIKDDDKINLETYYEYLYDNYVEYNEEYIYQKVFLYACTIGAKDCIKWLFSIYEDLDPIEQISIRQMFFYGKYLIQFYKHQNILDFYEEFLNNKSIKIEENIKI
jgi:hypothetical protein